MQTGSRMAFFVVACLVLMMPACRPASPGQDPVGTVAIDAELSEAEVLAIVRSSLAAYPWRLEQSVLVKDTGQTITGLTEAQSSTRGYNRSVQSVGAETITLETILIDSLVYLKISGSPAEAYGLVDGQWTEVPPDSPLSQFIDRGAIDPARIAEIFATDFKAVSGGEKLFSAAGSEEVNGVPTTIYESTGETFTYRWWIGSDRRFYKTTVDLPQAGRTIVMEYDPDIEVQAPVP
jgi:hypothetical protein